MNSPTILGYSRNAWLDSEYMFCISMGRFWTKFTFFYVDVDLNLEVVLFHSYAEWRSS